MSIVMDLCSISRVRMMDHDLMGICLMGGKIG